VLVNRVVWSLVFMVAVLTWQQNWAWLGPALRARRVVLPYLIAAVLLSVNWYIYIWAVANDHILESSLGYFINPLVNVLLGVLFFRERLRPGQWAAVAIAAAGVLYLTLNLGQLPWIALSLAFSFGLYGLVKKTAPLAADRGLTLETGLMFLPALAYMGYLFLTGTSAVPDAPGGTRLLLVLAGPITAVPLLLFAAAARRIPLTMLGIMQYIAPTGQFLVAVFLYNEPFPTFKLVGFAIVWVALIVFTVEGLTARRRALKLAATTA
jgi:chloramphenicol-sensitive protein RarD